MIPSRIILNDDLLPEFTRTLTTTPDLEAVSSWLNELPMADAVKSSEIILAFLGSLNRNRLYGVVRLQVLEQLQPIVNKLAPMLEEQLMDDGFPLDARTRKTAEVALGCYTELANCYLLIANDKTVFTSQQIAKQQGLVLHRILDACLRVQKSIARMYESVPEEFWKQVFFSYAKAEQLAVEHQSMATSEAGQDDSATISDLFNQILLFSLANPNRYRQRHHRQILALIAKFANLCKIQDSEDCDGHGATFFIDLSLDSPPRHISHMESSNSGHLRFLDTRKLVQAMIHDSRNVENDSEKSSLQDQTERSLAVRVARSLGAPKRRKSMRVADESERTLIIGMRSIIDTLAHSRLRARKDSQKPAEKKVADTISASGIEPGPYLGNEALSAAQTPAESNYRQHNSGRFLAKIKPINVPESDLIPIDRKWETMVRNDQRNESNMLRWFGDTDSHRMNIDDIWGTIGNKWKPTEDEPEPQKENNDASGRLVNYSVSGYRMVWLGDASARIKVGELIASEVDEQQFEVGSVCWIFNSQAGELSFGIELLSLSADVVKFKAVGKAPTTDFGILLTGPKSAPGGVDPNTTILLPASTYRQEDQLDLEFGDTRARYRLEKLLESTSAYNRYSLGKVH